MFFCCSHSYSLSVYEMWYPSPQQTQTAVIGQPRPAVRPWGEREGFGEKGEGDQTRHAAHLELFKSISITTGEPLWRLCTVDCNHNAALSKLLALLLQHGRAGTKESSKQMRDMLQRAMDRLASKYWLADDLQDISCKWRLQVVAERI